MEGIQVGPEGIVAEVAGEGPYAIMAVLTVPTSGLRGYAHGCIVINLRGTTSIDALYINVGTKTSCNFQPYSPFSNALRSYTVPLTSLRVWDAIQTNLPGTAASDDLALIGGTYLTSAPTVKTLDFVNTNTLAYARFQFPVPVTYVAGQPITLVMNVICTGSPSVEGTVDAFVVRPVAPTVDICATAAQNYSISAADYTFTITPTDVVAGELLDVRVKLTGTDDTNVGNWITTINSIKLNFTTKEAA